MKKVACISALALLACGGAFAQGQGGNVVYQSTGQAAGTDGGAPGEIVNAKTMAIGAFAKPTAPVTGAPYSATISNEFVQMLADGNRIVNNSSGTVARDSQGRTRQDAPIPSIGNVSAANAPHIVFIQDPVAQVAYTLNLTDKTAQKIPMPPVGPGGAAMIGGPAGPVIVGSAGGPAAGGDAAGAVMGSGPVTTGAGGGNVFFVQTAGGAPANGAIPPPITFQKTLITNDSSDAKTEDLGSESMEGLSVTGTRTTRTIPTGQIGNDKPIQIVTEVWTSPDLKTIVSSKRSDPRMGEQTFQLTNVTRAEPDASLFTVPPDFKVIEGPQKIVYRTNP